MLSEQQKEIRVIEGFKFRFHKMLQGDGSTVDML